MDDLTTTQKALLGLNLGLHAYDWSETRKIVGSGGKEVNPYVGKHPSPEGINQRVAATGALGLGALATMPKEWRTAALAVGALAKIALLNGDILGNDPMWKPKDKNSPAIAAIAALTPLLLGLEGVGVEADKDKLAIKFKKDF